MEYAKILKQSAGKFDYRESPIDTVIKVNNLKKTINKDGRQSLPRQETYANKISTMLTKEELKRHINDGARHYLSAVQQQHNDLKLNFLNQSPDNQESYLKEARKQEQFMKLLNDPQQLDYLNKVDPFGLFVLRMEQENDNAKLQQQIREQQLNDSAKNVIAPEFIEQAQKISLEDLAKIAKSMKMPSVSIAGSNITIGNQPISSKKKAVEILDKYAPELKQALAINPNLRAKDLVDIYNSSMIYQEKQKTGADLDLTPIDRFKREQLNAQKDFAAQLLQEKQQELERLQAAREPELFEKQAQQQLESRRQQQIEKSPFLTFEEIDALPLPDLRAYARTHNIRFGAHTGKPRLLKEIEKAKIIKKPTLSGRGFSPRRSSYRNKQIDQNEYNREQARELTNNAIHGEGFFGDLKDKFMNWAFYNIHPLGIMSKYASEAIKK